jgi:hypothetical protein
MTLGHESELGLQCLPAKLGSPAGVAQDRLQAGQMENSVF